MQGANSSATMVLAHGRAGRRGQSQDATYTGGFQDFIVWALMPHPKLKSRGATSTGSATFARGFMVVFQDILASAL